MKKKKVVKKKGGQQSSFAGLLSSLTGDTAGVPSLLSLFSGSQGIVPGMPGTGGNSPKKKVTIKK